MKRKGGPPSARGKARGIKRSPAPSSPSSSSRAAPPRERAKVQARPANLRERALFEGEREPAWLRVALDALARHRAAREPLDRALEQGARTGRLGPRERRRAGDLVFAWARARSLVEGVVADAIKAYGGVPPPVRERDRAALALAALASELEPIESPLPSPLAELVAEARELGVGALAKGDRPSLPSWLSERLMAQYGERADALVSALRAPAPVVLAFDPRHVDRETVLRALENLEVEAEPSPLSPVGVRVKERFSLRRLPRAVRDHVWPMDDGSQAVVLALDPKEGDVVLDFCAGGGGKTRLLLALGARVVAMDPDKGRLTAVHTRSRGQGPVACVRGDGTRAPFRPGSFAKVLVDAPCSGIGTLRRAPDVADRFRPEMLEEMTRLQEELLVAARSLATAAGTIVYATCSLLPDENERVVERALARRADLSLVEARTLLPSEHGTDGFFVATLACQAG